MIILLIIVIILLINLVIFLSVFKNPQTKIKDIVYDWGVVCGYPASDDGSPSLIMKSRIEAGVKLYQAGKIKKILVSGGAVKNQYVEAKVMKAYAIKLGVKKEDIIVEDKSVSTYHNLMYCSKIVKDDQCLVITNSWHLRKADHYARKFKLNYAMYKAKAPQSFSILKIIGLHIDCNLIMYRNFFKGLS